MVTAESLAVFLEVPVPVVKRADLPGFEPAGDAVEVEGVVADAPGDGALVVGVGVVLVSAILKIHHNVRLKKQTNFLAPWHDDVV